jgi:hypothetical protein
MIAEIPFALELSVAIISLVVALPTAWAVFRGANAWLVTHAKRIEALDAVIASAPVIVEIAQQFKNNGGSSLKDSLDRLEADAKAAKEISEATDKKLDRMIAHCLNNTVNCSGLVEQFKQAHDETTDNVL